MISKYIKCAKTKDIRAEEKSSGDITGRIISGEGITGRVISVEGFGKGHDFTLV